MTELDKDDRLICLRAGEAFEEYQGAVLPPISQASLYRKRTMKELLQGLSSENKSFVYSRGTNPTVKVLEDTLAKLERTEVCKCFGSGMGAVSATLFGLLKSGDHILFLNDIYGPTLELASRLSQFGISHCQAFSNDIGTIEQEIRKETKIIYMESPGSMLFQLLPIKKVCEEAKKRNIITVIDNTVSTPLLQKPIKFGADLIIHSCSKYIGGHSDVIGGAVLGTETLINQIFYNGYMLLGSVMSPFDAWLLLRGLMTLPDRIERHHQDALKVAGHLHDHQRIRRVFHPALNVEDATLFKSQMIGHSGLFSAELDVDSFNDTLAIADSLRLFGKAVSWGGAESLVVSGHKSDPGISNNQRIPRTLLRFSIGLEGAQNLIADLDAALR